MVAASGMRPNSLGPETAQSGGGLRREGVGVEKLIPSLESSCLVSKPRENRLCPGDISGISWDVPYP